MIDLTHDISACVENINRQATLVEHMCQSLRKKLSDTRRRYTPNELGEIQGQAGILDARCAYLACLMRTQDRINREEIKCES